MLCTWEALHFDLSSGWHLVVMDTTPGPLVTWHRCIFWKILVGGGGKFSGFWGNYLRMDKINQKTDKFGLKWAKIPLFSSKFPQNCQNFLKIPNIFQKLPKFLQNRPFDWDFLVKNCAFWYKFVGEIFGALARTGEIIKFRGRIYSREDLIINV